MSVNFEFEKQDPRDTFYGEQSATDAIQAAAQIDLRGVHEGDIADSLVLERIDEVLELLHPKDVVDQHTSEFLDEVKFNEISEGRTWAVAIFAGDDPRSIIAKRVENERFSKFFKHHPLEHYIDYGIYDEASTFVTVIDASDPSNPQVASALRIVEDSEIGLKTINTLASPRLEENPWYPEVEQITGESSYENQDRVRKIITQMFDIIPTKTWAIETMAVLDRYAGKKGEFGEASFPLYAACLQLANRANIDSWISIQDLKPLNQMQEIFSNPWSITPLSVQDYEGEYPTIPAVIRDLPQAQNDLRTADKATAELLIDGVGLSDVYVMPEELQGEAFLNAVTERNKIQ